MRIKNPSALPRDFYYVGLLMLLAEEVVDGLHGIEGAEGHFNEDC